MPLHLDFLGQKKFDVPPYKNNVWKIFVVVIRTYRHVTRAFLLTPHFLVGLEQTLAFP